MACEWFVTCEDQIPAVEFCYREGEALYTFREIEHNQHGLLRGETLVDQQGIFSGVDQAQIARIQRGMLSSQRDQALIKVEQRGRGGCLVGDVADLVVGMDWQPGFNGAESGKGMSVHCIGERQPSRPLLNGQ